MKVLLSVDGSEPSIRAVNYLIKASGWFKTEIEVHLLNVQHELPYGGRVGSVLGRDAIEKYHQEQGAEQLKQARSLLDAAHVKYHAHIGVGDEASVIAAYAKDKHCDQIYMGTRGLGPVTGMVLGSVATKVIHLSPVSVLLVK